jgi:CheY-like chemotaxis protein
MDEEQQQKALEPFYTSKGEQGTGMGLAAVYGTMRRHGGDLEIDSSPGSGTRVRLIFPRSEAQSAAADTRNADGARAEPMNVLCVDDDPTALQSLRYLLEIDGHGVTAAEGGIHAAELVEAQAGNGEEPFDAVITDLGMPHLDGRELARLVKERYPDTSVILVSGWHQQMSPEQDRPEHVDAFLGKPPELHELRRVLREIGAMQSEV